MEPYQEFAMKTRREEAWLNSRPVCEHCGRPIQNERLLDVEGLLYHVKCFVNEHERDTEDYVF